MFSFLIITIKENTAIQDLIGRTDTKLNKKGSPTIEIVYILLNSECTISMQANMQRTQRFSGICGIFEFDLLSNKIFSVH